MEQVELAKAIGVHVNSISRWERGGTIKQDRLSAICKVTNTPMSYFLRDDISEQTTVKVGGIEIEGPADKLAAIITKLQQEPEQPPRPAVENGARPNTRHSGIHEMLDLHERGTFKARYGMEITPEEEEGLRTYGRSGPPVDTIEKAIEVVLQWREWEIKDRAKP